MRSAVLTLILLAPPLSAQPTAAHKARAALALASSCDCPDVPKCGDKVAAVLAKVSRDMDDEARVPAVAPMPRVKAKSCGCDDCKCPAGACPDCPKAGEQLWSVPGYPPMTKAQIRAIWPRAAFPDECATGNCPRAVR